MTLLTRGETNALGSLVFFLGQVNKVTDRGDNHSNKSTSNWGFLVLGIGSGRWHQLFTTFATWNKYIEGIYFGDVSPT